MEKLSLKKNNDWWILLLEGSVLISLGIILFRYPEEILTAIAYWFSLFIVLAGAIGTIFWFFRDSGKKILHLVVSIVIIIAGILMVTKTIATITAVTTVFGLMTIVVSIVLIKAGWEERRAKPAWLLPVLCGFIALAISIKGMIDTFSERSVISHFIGKSVLVAGIGLVVLAFLKMRTKYALGKTKSTVTEKLN